MKRPRKHGRGYGTTGDVRVDFSEAQLAGIGAVSLAFNETQYLLEQILYSGLRLRASHWIAVTARLSLGDKCLLAKDAITELHRLAVICFERDDLANILHMKGSIGDFETLKTYRDAVIHARVGDSRDGLGTFIDYNARVLDVLMTAEALTGLYDRLVLCRQEFHGIVDVCSLLFTGMTYGPFGPTGLPPSLEAPARLKSVLDLQNQRRSLPPLPAFPD